MKKSKSKKEKKPKEKNFIYVQIDYEGAMNSKKEVLSYQMELLNMLKSIKKYRFLRREEESIRADLQNKLKKINENIVAIERKIPKVQEPKLEKKETPEKNIEKKPIIEYYNQDLDSQLEQIKNKLAKMEK